MSYWNKIILDWNMCGGNTFKYNIHIIITVVLVLTKTWNIKAGFFAELSVQE